MARLKIGDKVVQVDDSFLQLPQDEQQRVVDEIAASLGNDIVPRETKPAAAAAPAPSGEGDVTASNVFKAGLRGIPVLGGMMNQGAAAIDAATQPLMGSLSGSQAPTFAERRAENLKANQANQEAFAKESPIASTGAELAGGVGATLAAAATKVGAKLLGLTGRTLPAQVKQGAISGGGIGALDAMVRDEDPVLGGEVGAALGAAVPVVGAGLGAGARAIRRSFTPPSAPVQQAAQTVDVAGNPVRMSQSEMTGDAAQAGQEQALRRGGRGDEAQRAIQEWEAGRAAEIRAADDAVMAAMDPSGRSLRARPADAAEAVQTELTQTARTNAAFDEQARILAAQEGADIAAAAGGGRTVADAPFTAGEILAQGFNRANTAARGARDRAYAAARAADVEITPPAVERIEQAVRARLNEPERVRLNDRTPNANEALARLRQGLWASDQNPVPPRMGPDGRPIQPNVTGTDIDETRKDLIAMRRAANAAARSSGDNTDARAMGRIIDAYDDVVEQAARVGTVRGDGPAFMQQLRAARQAHADYKRGFSSQGPQDEVGKIIEKIVAREVDQRMTPDKLASLAFGPASAPGGQTAQRVAARIREQFGEQSDEWAAYRQGLLAHITETAPGTAPRTPVEIAERMQEFVNGRGRGLAEEAFNPAERARLLAHAEQVRATQPAGRPADTVSRIMQRITGEDGNPPATVNEIVDRLFGANGQGTKDTVPLLRALKLQLTPESWALVKQAQYSKLTEVPEGMIDKKAQALSQQLHQFLNGKGKEAAEVLYTQRERDLIGQMANVYKRMIPVEGSTNPSGTAPMLAKMVGKLQNVLLPLLGFSQGGMIGAGAGLMAQKGMERLVTRQAAKEATTRFYGEQPKPVVARRPPSNIPSAITRGAQPALTN